MILGRFTLNGQPAALFSISRVDSNARLFGLAVSVQGWKLPCVVFFVWFWLIILGPHEPEE